MADFRDIRRQYPGTDQTPVWRLDNEEPVPTMRLFKCSEEEYRTIEQGALVPIFCSPLFIIVNDVILEFLNAHIREQITSHPVTIYDRPTCSYFSGYHRIYIKEVIDILVGLPTDTEKKIWLYPDSGFVFISLALKQAMEAAGVQGVYYYPGLAFIG